MSFAVILIRLGVVGLTLIGHTGMVAIVIGHVVDNLNSAIGQGHFVTAFGHRPRALFLLVEIRSRPSVFDSIGERVGSFL